MTTICSPTSSDLAICEGDVVLAVLLRATAVPTSAPVALFGRGLLKARPCVGDWCLWIRVQPLPFADRAAVSYHSYRPLGRRPWALPRTLHYSLNVEIKGYVYSWFTWRRVATSSPLIASFLHRTVSTQSFIQHTIGTPVHASQKKNVDATQFHRNIHSYIW